VIHGRDTYADLAALPGTPEAAAVMTSADVALQQIEQLIAMGTKRIMVVSNGFGELGTDEGRAMLEIVHDVAPGAQLYFHSAFNNTQTPGWTSFETAAPDQTIADEPVSTLTTMPRIGRAQTT
jgi:hypothetical protein